MVGGAVVACGFLAVGLMFLGGCGAGESVDADDVVLTIEEALAARPGEPIKVTGAVLAKGIGADVEIVLASAMAESYPPQAGGATLAVEGLNLDSLVGLNSTVDEPELAPVTWSDYWVVLGGFIKDGVFQVQEAPRVVEAISSDLRLRFSPVSEPFRTGENIWWAFDVKNEGAASVRLTFSSGQRAEVVLSQDGEEKYRWSADKVFTEALETVPLAEGDVLPIILNDTLQVASGDYDLAATITAVVGPEGATVTLPELTATVSVR